MTSDKIAPLPILFKIEASRCDLQIGDPVTPETLIGQAWDTGEPVLAGRQGTVEAISFNSDHHALVVVIRPIASDDEAEKLPAGSEAES